MSTEVELFAVPTLHAADVMKSLSDTPSNAAGCISRTSGSVCKSPVKVVMSKGTHGSVVPRFTLLIAKFCVVILRLRAILSCKYRQAVKPIKNFSAMTQ